MLESVAFSLCVVLLFVFLVRIWSCLSSSPASGCYVYRVCTQKFTRRHLWICRFGSAVTVHVAAWK